MSTRRDYKPTNIIPVIHDVLATPLDMGFDRLDMT